MKEIVIKLTDHCYKRVVDYKENLPVQILEAIRHGVVLPKGHGRIGDLDALRCENADFDTYKDYCIMFDEIEAAETIIEADEGDGGNDG